MKNKTHLLACAIAFIVLVAIGCGQSSTSIVGNPSIPTLGKVFGTYSSDVDFTQDQIDSFDSVSFTSIDNNCEDDDDVAHTVSAGDTSDTVILTDFFDYSDATSEITADYNATTGILSFFVDDGTNQIDCSGQIIEYSNEVLLGLDCTVTGPQAESCGVTASKPL